jgi:hypothetical protein
MQRREQLLSYFNSLRARQMFREGLGRLPFLPGGKICRPMPGQIRSG